MQAINVSVILPAAGVGSRFAQGPARPGPSKIEQQLAGKPVFLHAVDLFAGRSDVGQVIIAVAPDQLDDFKFRYGEKLGFLGIKIVAGGEIERWQTVANALKAVSDDATHIAVHDAARPLATSAMIDRVFEAAARFPAVIPACDVGSTLKQVEIDDSVKQEADPLDAILGTSEQDDAPIRRVIQTIDRRNLVAVQTPQVFEANLLRRAYQQIADGRIATETITDDAQLIEALGESVHVVEGETTNLKITYPADAELAEALLAKRATAQAADLAIKRLFGPEDDED